MKRILETTIFSRFVFVHLLILSFAGQSQVIGTPTVNASGGPISVSFTVTNGNGSPNHFTGSTNFTAYLSDSSGNNFSPISTFNSSVFPIATNGASCTITKTIPIPYGTPSGSGYKITIGSGLPNVNAAIGSNASAPFTLFCNFSLPATLSGFIKSSSPALNYYLLTITNTGNVSDSYTLASSQTGTPLTVQFQTLAGATLTTTPILDPNESYTFMVRFDTPNGTNPNNTNTTTINATSINCAITHSCVISTFIYGGAGSPNLPNSPDLEVIKTANTASAFVGDYIDYTLTMRNNTTKIASNPAIKDILPNNADLISYSKLASDTRNIIFTYDNVQNTLTALLEGNLINSSLPVTINVRVRTKCNSVPTVLNSAEAYTVSGDSNSLNDSSLVSTSVNYDLSNSSIGTWTGAVSTDWFDCRNWSGGVVPTNSISVTIPTVVNNPVINSLSTFAPADQIARCFNITIQNSRSLSMINQSNLNVAGDWFNYGSFNSGNGTVTFNGLIANNYQQLIDSSSQPSFYNLATNTQNNSKGISIPDNYGLFVTNNIDLISGNIRLNGKAQLIQSKVGVSTNSTSGTGKILRDQQGQSNLYNYNFWSSPVGGSTYTVAGVLRDGTNPSNPQNINWIGGYDGAATSPISLASYWIFKFQNLTSNYANWSNIGPNGVLNVGQGFTLKGSGAASSNQNYTFEGKPNSGLITNPIAASNLNLSGNPYPSALDAFQFIDDNSSSTNGALYFWEHSSSNNSHFLSSYQGGYAMLTKTGGTPAVAPAGINGVGMSAKIPQRYVPVAQGFFVYGSATGGIIKFQNSQRAFKTETDVNSNFMFRQNYISSNENHKKIRLNFTNNTTTLQRELLVGFMDQLATNNFDLGYDGEQIDSQNSDMYFTLNDKKLTVQGLGSFSSDTSIPIGLTIGTNGYYTISLKNLENFENLEKVYLFDSQTSTYHNLYNNPFSAYLNAGNYNNRFSIRFTKNSSLEKNSSEDYKTVALSCANQQLFIQPIEGIQSIELINLVGQRIAQWNTIAEAYDLSGFTDGTYIVKINFDHDTITRKIVK